MKTQLKTIRAALEDLDDQYNSRKWDALTALTQLERMAGEPFALLVRKNSWNEGQWECAPPNSPNYGLVWANERMFVYAAPPAQQPQAEKHATMAGLESSINILSSLVDEQRQLLAEVDAVFGVDAHGIVLEDGDSALIDRVRSHIAATNGAQQPQAEAVPSDVVCEKDPMGCWNVRCQLGKVCKNAAMKQGNQP